MNSAHQISFHKDTRFLTVRTPGFLAAELQMAYSVSVACQVVGYVRQTNHGVYRWTGVTPTGANAGNFTTRHAAAAALLRSTK